MTNTNRRNFLQQASAISAAVAMPYSLSAMMNMNLSKRKFTLDLSPGAIGVNASQEELVDYCIQYGFESLAPSTQYLMEEDAGKLKALTDKMKKNKIVWGSAGLPVDFRKSDSIFKEGLANLSKHAKALEKFGATRMNTWIMPNHADLTYRANFKQHTERIKEMAKVLADSNVRLGLEYVGPKTLMTANKYAFIHTLPECKELISEINEANVGVVLDSFHWFTGGDTKEDLLSLTNKDVVACDLNDARANLTADEQIDGKRELPLATGVIDLKTFMEALVTIGYDGPVRAEPFNQKLRDMDNDEALKTTVKAMKKGFDLIGG
ncbi:sugar phosphate isomerase/epimerase family protein [Flexithrix dorotheae]|uniref:sugar phosphate isomerase/epimerase family protein n=1 Tax=Flexithrix dorotheae TaxID=70993 RepID=UPI00036F1ECC|nr:sugar phosphate isomerase/epimerase family protein [Flexithrix dorotheae]